MWHRRSRYFPVFIDGHRPPSEPETEAPKTDNHHIYRDPSGFDYDITLKRTDVDTDSTETYQLRVSFLDSLFSVASSQDYFTPEEGEAHKLIPMLP